MPHGDIRTIEESYVSATSTSNLRVEADRRGDGDVLIAAGWAPGILGGALLRLHSEFDSTAMRLGSRTDALRLYGQLKSLPRVLELLTAWATGRGIDAPQALAQAVTAHWLHSTCTHCHGRGKDVIAGTPSLGKQCRACGGTGKRKEPRGEAGRMALNMMDEAVMGARISIKKRLRNSMNV